MAESFTAVEVAVSMPVDRTFTYRVPEAMRDRAVTGMMVLVPFGRRKVTGYILGPSGESPAGELKDLEACLDDEPVFSEPMLAFFKWVSAYYLVSLGEVIRTALPAGLNSTSLRVVRPTAAGMKAAPSELKGKEKAVFAFVTGGGEIAVSSVEGGFGKSGLSALYRLAAMGFVEVGVKIKGARVRIRKVKYVRSARRDGDVPGGAGKRALEILRHVEKAGEVPLARLVEEAGTTRKTVRKLEGLGLLEVFEKEVFRDPFRLPVMKVEPPVLTGHQEEALHRIRAALEKRDFSPFLLEGRTGSGKTEVYLRAIEAASGGAIVLVPEISLTPQLTTRFRERFGDRVALLHSGLSAGERYDQWRRIREGRCDIVVGARSAVFAPLGDVRVVIVDEEHEPSYKQEDGVRYNARDLALVRGRMEGAVVILGSATPSLESVKNACEGRYTHLLLPERVSGRPLPSIEIIDLKKEKKNGWITPRLQELIGENLERGEQTLLFLNRRGFAPSVICRDCGHTFRCRNCAVTLTWHQREDLLVCHYCGFKTRGLPLCSECGGSDVTGLGIGTERLETELRNLFPGGVLARMDRDTTGRKGAVEGIVRSLEKREIDILIGTQMVAKGHHFPGVTLVGVLLADQSLNIPDFRAAERTFQLLTQVAGRAGRGDAPGKVVIQTYNPDHYAILHGGENESGAFYDTEMAVRRETFYPPFSRLVNFRIEGSVEEVVARSAGELRSVARRILGVKGDVEILGPAPSPLSRLKRRYRWQMLARCEKRSTLHRFVKKVMLELKSSGKISKGVKIVPDFDPYTLI